MKSLSLALTVLVFCSSPAWANPVPYPPNCEFSTDVLNGVILCPDEPGVINESVVLMTIRNQANNPMPDTYIIITFGQGPLCFCPSMSYTTMTDNEGHASLILRGGGCLRGQDQAAVIRGNGSVVRDYFNVKSPDWDGASGNCLVNLGDVVRFVSHDPCFDFGNNGTVDLGDFVIFGAGYSPAHRCP